MYISVSLQCMTGIRCCKKYFSNFSIKKYTKVDSKTKIK